METVEELNLDVLKFQLMEESLETITDLMDVIKEHELSPSIERMFEKELKLISESYLTEGNEVDITTLINEMEISQEGFVDKIASVVGGIIDKVKKISGNIHDKAEKLKTNLESVDVPEKWNDDSKVSAITRKENDFFVVTSKNLTKNFINKVDGDFSNEALQEVGKSIDALGGIKSKFTKITIKESMVSGWNPKSAHAAALKLIENIGTYENNKLVSKGLIKKMMGSAKSSKEARTKSIYIGKYLIYTNTINYFIANSVYLALKASK